MSNQTQNKDSHPAQAAMRHAIAERRKVDPMIGVKIGSRELVSWLTSVLKDAKGVHAETLLCVLGSLAGYACQAGIRAHYMYTLNLPEQKVFIVMGAQDGKKYFYGDLLNKPLCESQYSVWSMAAGAVQHLGHKPFDYSEIFKHVTMSAGGASFGIPRVPEGHKSGILPIDSVKAFWPKILPAYLREYCVSPLEWHMVLGAAIQQVIFDGKDIIDPMLALTIVMESAVPMSKIDLDAIAGK
jgi:hypothetical protein